MRLRAYFRPLIASLLAFAIGLDVLRRGVPAMRHDWSWPLSAAQLRNHLSAYLGWDTVGFGQPHPLVGSYGVDAALRLLSYVLAPAPLLFAFLVFALAVFIFGILRFADLPRGSRWYFAGETALAAFAAANPWIYDKLVAGHVDMILACGATALLFAPRTHRLAPASRLVLLLLAAAQIQFFLIVVVGLLPGLFAEPDRRDATGLAVVAAPVAAGVVINWHFLGHVPLLLAWQRVQSVAPASAVALRGYFPGYDAGFAGAATIGLYAAAATFAVSTIARPERRKAFLSATCALAIFAFVTGTKGPAAAAYVWGFAHFKALGVYRESFDLLGVVVALYAWGLAWVARTRLGVAFVSLIGALLLRAWIVHPIAAWWVGAAEIPVIRVHTGPAFRFALMPPFQPLSFHGHGSGADPDVFARTDGSTPLNAYSPTIAAASALDTYARTGDPARLAALGVRTVVVRPYLRPAGGHAAAAAQAHETHVRDAIPLFSLLRHAPRVSTPSRPGTGAIFFADTASAPARRVRTLRAAATASDPARGWVDAWQAFAAHPALAEPFGGVYTRSRRELAVAAPFVLAWVDGELRGGHGERLSGPTHHYAWIRLDRSTRRLRCLGRCVVLYQGLPPPLPVTVAPVPWKPLAFRALPFLIYATSAPASGILRMNAGYSAHWFALRVRPLRVLAHVRIDGTANGWYLAGTRGLLLIANWATLTEVGLTTLALLYLIASIAREFTPARKRAHKGRRGPSP